MQTTRLDGYEIYQNMLGLVEESGAKVRLKSSSPLMKIIGVLLYPFNRTFMTRYTTTIGSTIYVPKHPRRHNELSHLSSARTLAHELVHVFDYQRQPFWFVVSYLLPQILSLLALLAVLSIWIQPMIWFLVFLAFLAPFPSHWRTYWEVRGYSMSAAFNYWAGLTETVDPSRYYDAFVGSSYYFMWPFRDDVAERFIPYVEETEEDLLFQSIPTALLVQEALGLLSLEDWDPQSVSR